MYMSIDEIVDDMMLYRMSEASKLAIKRMTDHELMLLDSTVGSGVRFHYHLWDPQNPYTMLNYQPQIVDDVDVNPKHPENMTHDIFCMIRKRMQ